MASCRCRRNVYMLAVAFLCNFASYMTLESMQSSLNRGIGTIALCLLYASLVVSSLFLPPLVIAKLNCKKSLTLSISTFAVYTLANFYPRPYTLIPAAIFLGMGSSVMWSCSFYYIMLLSQKHANEKKQCIEKVTGEFFGKFTAISHISILVGTLFMSVVFESVGLKGSDDVTIEVNGHVTTELGYLLNGEYPTFNATVAMDGNATSTAHSVSERYATSTSVYEQQPTCGLYYKFADTKVEKGKGVSDLIMYILLSAYLACNLVAALLCLCLDEVEGTETEAATEAAEEAVCQSMLSLNSNKMDLCTNNVGKSTERETLADKKENKGSSQQTSTFKLVKSTMRVLATDKAAWLLIPFTLHYGMIQGFARGVYNASWITCALGIKYVAYVTCMYAGVMIVFCYSFGKLLRYVTHVKIYCVTMTLETATLVLLLLWRPAAVTTLDTFLLFAVPFLLGICHSSLSSQIGSIYSKFFPDNRKSGSSLQGIWNPLGSAIAYGLSGPLFPVHMVIMVITVCVVGLLMYLIAEKIKEHPKRKCSGCSCI